MKSPRMTRGLGWTCAFSAALAGCYMASVDDGSKQSVTPKSQDIIGGFSANDASLNAAGVLAIKFPWGESHVICSAVLVADNLALTTKNCVDSLPSYFGGEARVVFSIGPDLYSGRDVEVADFERAPLDEGGFTGRGHDVGVVHLAEHISDVTPLTYAQLDASLVGKAFAAIGYGIHNNNEYEPTGSRKVGTVTLRARTGNVLEALGFTFAEYFRNYTGEELPTNCPAEEDDAGVPTGGRGGRGGTGGKGGVGGAGKGGSGGIEAGSGGAQAPNDYLCEQARYLREYYDTNQLEPTTEAVAGGAPGDATPCIGDQGGPMVRKDSAGKLTVYGVVIGGLSGDGVQCDTGGTVYAAFDKSVIDFIDQAKKWVDPCEGVSIVGACDGSVAKRCTNAAEGKRRQVSFDCASVDLSCETQYDGSPGCGQDGSFLPPPPPITVTQVDAAAVGHDAFRSPLSFVKQ